MKPFQHDNNFLPVHLNQEPLIVPHSLRDEEKLDPFPHLGCLVVILQTLLPEKHIEYASRVYRNQILHSKSVHRLWNFSIELDQFDFSYLLDLCHNLFLLQVQLIHFD